MSESQFKIEQIVFDEDGDRAVVTQVGDSPFAGYKIRLRYLDSGEEVWAQEHNLSATIQIPSHSIEGIVRRTTAGTSYPCHGSECLEVEGRTGMPSLPLDWMAGAMLPEGARIRITVEVLDVADGTVPLNWWHQNRHSYTPDLCVCKQHPGQTTIKIEELQ